MVPTGDCSCSLRVSALTPPHADGITNTCLNACILILGGPSRPTRPADNTNPTTLPTKIHPWCTPSVRTWYGICHDTLPLVPHQFYADKISGVCCCNCVLLADHRLPVEKSRNKPFVLQAPKANICIWKSNLSFLPTSRNIYLIGKCLTGWGKFS